MKWITTFLLVTSFLLVRGQIPKDGTYTYSIAFAEWNGKSNGATCTVIIKGDSIKVIHNGGSNLTGKKGGILDSGIILKHKTSEQHPQKDQ